MVSHQDRHLGVKCLLVLLPLPSVPTSDYSKLFHNDYYTKLICLQRKKLLAIYVIAFTQLSYTECSDLKARLKNLQASMVNDLKADVDILRGHGIPGIDGNLMEAEANKK